MLDLIRTDSENKQFQHLVSQLDAFLRVLDGDEHAFYSQFNAITTLRNAVVAFKDGQPVGCGAFKEFSDDTVEVKRMYVTPECRGNGIASQILLELEAWARELKYPKSVLETGIRQPEAIQLYLKNGYKRIPNFGQYNGINNSVCFEKKLTD